MSEMDALRNSYSAALDLIELLADDDPCTSSYEGLDDGCFFCGGYIDYVGMARVASHEKDCSWVAARILLGHSIAPHRIQADKPKRAEPLPAPNSRLIGY